MALSHKAGRNFFLDAARPRLYDEFNLFERIPPMPASADELRLVMRRWTSGVTVVTAAHGDERHGMTVSSFTSVSLEPPLVMISLQTSSRTHALVMRSGHFGLTILAAGQQELSERFAGRMPDSADRLAGMETETLVSGAPLLRGGLAMLDCRVTQAIPCGGNTLFLGEVLAARSGADAPPLVYFDRGYRTLRE